MFRSLGCIIYELLVGHPPFKTTCILDLDRLIKSEAIKFPENTSTNCVNFLRVRLARHYFTCFKVTVFFIVRVYWKKTPNCDSHGQISRLTLSSNTKSRAAPIAPIFTWSKRTTFVDISTIKLHPTLPERKVGKVGKKL